MQRGPGGRAGVLFGSIKVLEPVVIRANWKIPGAFRSRADGHRVLFSQRKDFGGRVWPIGHFLSLGGKAFRWKSQDQPPRPERIACVLLLYPSKVWFTDPNAAGVGGGVSGFRRQTQLFSLLPAFLRRPRIGRSLCLFPTVPKLSVCDHQGLT